MFLPEPVVCKSRGTNVVPKAQDAITDGHCSLQLGVFEPPSGSRAEPWWGPEGKAPGISRDPTVYISQKNAKYTLVVFYTKILFYEFC